jgi:hypothetical protein
MEEASREAPEANEQKDLAKEKEEVKEKIRLLRGKRKDLEKMEKFGEKEELDLSAALEKIESEIKAAEEEVLLSQKKFFSKDEKSANLFISSVIETSGIEKIAKDIGEKLDIKAEEESPEDPIAYAQNIRRQINSIDDSSPEAWEISFLLKDLPNVANEIGEELGKYKGDGLENDVFGDTASWFMSLAELARDKETSIEKKIRASKEKE